MIELHLPWIELMILLPLCGAAVVSRIRDPVAARQSALVFTGLALFFAVGAWLDFDLTVDTSRYHAAEDRGLFQTRLIGREVFTIDQLSAPLLPLVALLFFLTTITTLRTKIRRFSFVLTLVSEAILLATFACREPWVIIAGLAMGTAPPYLELRARGEATRAYVAHLGLFVVLLVVGWSIVEWEGSTATHSLWAIGPLLLAVMIRSGIAPFHCWMIDLFDRATFGTALLFVTPSAGAYAAIRLVWEIAPNGVLLGLGIMSLVTAVYAAGMALIQREGRRFFCYLFLSHSALVLVGLETTTSLGLTGSLCVWLAVGFSLAGFGLTMRALEARRGRLSLAEYQGLYDHTPNLAMCFLLTGLASVGFPGTLGFVGMELLVDGAVEAYPLIGVAVVVAAALSGIAVLHAYFRIFTGTHYFSTISLKIGVRERYAVLTLAALILLGGLVPQPGVHSRHLAAEELLKDRAKALGELVVAAEHVGHEEIVE